MIVTEFYRIKMPGRVRLYLTYSDEGYYIERDGVEFESAVDPEGSGRVYTETEKKIPGWEPKQ